MANITFHVDPDVHARMKQHPEIKWSEIFRRSIIEYLVKLESSDVTTARELWSRMSTESKDIITDLSENLDIGKEKRIATRLHELDTKRHSQA